MKLTSFFGLALGAALSALSMVGCGGDDSGEKESSGTEGEEDANSGGADGDGTKPTCEDCENGCCTSWGACVPLGDQRDIECGPAGGACQDCGHGRFCADGGGTCEVDTTVCSEHTCPSGCCSYGECITDTYWGSCGGKGEVCYSCDSYGVTCNGVGECTSEIHDDAVFYVRIRTVVLNQTNEGASWDLGSPPDPFVCISDGVEESCTETECEDSLECSFPESRDLDIEITGKQLRNGSTVLTVWDDDGFAHDEAGSTALAVTDISNFYELAPFGAVTKLEVVLR